jgi:hypothetical protein
MRQADTALTDTAENRSTGFRRNCRGVHVAAILKRIDNRRADVARVDEEAARREIARAAEFTARADELATIVDVLREQARRHLNEADDLRGVIRKRVNARE